MLTGQSKGTEVGRRTQEEGLSAREIDSWLGMMPRARAGTVLALEKVNKLDVNSDMK